MTHAEKIRAVLRIYPELGSNVIIPEATCDDILEAVDRDGKDNTVDVSRPGACAVGGRVVWRF